MTGSVLIFALMAILHTQHSVICIMDKKNEDDEEEIQKQADESLSKRRMNTAKFVVREV